MANRSQDERIEQNEKHIANLALSCAQSDQRNMIDNHCLWDALEELAKANGEDHLRAVQRHRRDALNQITDSVGASGGESVDATTRIRATAAVELD